MSKKLVFDTLHYATMLKDAGIEDYDIHAHSLAEAISQNVYTKVEVDKMIEDLIKQMEANRHKFEISFQQMLAKSDQNEAKFDKRLIKLEARLQARSQKAI